MADIDDGHIDGILRRYRVIDPPPGLRERCVTPPPRQRSWPWALAAAILLAAIIAIEVASATLRARVSLPAVSDALLELSQ